MAGLRFLVVEQVRLGEHNSRVKESRFYAEERSQDEIGTQRRLGRKLGSGKDGIVRQGEDELRDYCRQKDTVVPPTRRTTVMGCSHNSRCDPAEYERFSKMMKCRYASRYTPSSARVATYTALASGIQRDNNHQKSQNFTTNSAAAPAQTRINSLFLVWNIPIPFILGLRTWRL